MGEKNSMNDIITSAQLSWKESHGISRAILIFWILGPWFFLIERSPADGWISLTGLLFLIRSGITGDWRWLQIKWVIAVIIFVLTIIISSFFSALFSTALIESIIWVRFPLYAVAATYWLGRNSNRLAIMFLSMLLSASVMSCILLFEIWLEPNKIRLEGPYGDLVPGLFLGKAMLPIGVISTVIALKSSGFKGILIGTIPFSLLMMTLLTGERMNTGVLGLAIILAAFFSSTNWLKIFYYSVCGFLGTLIVFWLKGDTIFIRTFVDTSNLVGNYFNTGYWGSVRPGVIAAMEYPFTGLGTGTLRFLCSELPLYNEILPGITECHTHNHQFYIQLMAEGGIFALITGITMITLIITASRGKTVGDGWMQGVRPWIIPLVIFLPQTNADFYGQWHNSFIWFSIGYALSLSNIMIRNKI